MEAFDLFILFQYEAKSAIHLFHTKLYVFNTNTLVLSL